MSEQRIGYGRVSTVDQNPDSQRDALTAANVDRVYIDHYTGTKSSRPGFDQLREHLREGDTVVVTRLDRLGRSLKDLLAIAEDFKERGVNLEVTEQAINTRTPEGRLFYALIGAFAEFEHDLIVARTKDGLAAARARGRKGGRKPKMDAKKIEMARQIYDQGRTIVDIAAVLGTSRPTIYRALEAAK